MNVGNDEALDPPLDEKQIECELDVDDNENNDGSNNIIFGNQIVEEPKAKINAKLYYDGRFTLSTVVLEHTHAVSPSKARYFTCHKKLDARVKRRLEVMDKAGVRPSKNYKAFAIEAGGYKNLSFGEKDCRNYINKVRNELLGEGDAEAFLKYLMRMQEKNDRFFYVIDLDEESRLKNVFWADARSRAAYESFGDVITFDTTYLTNKYKMPFAPFVGVNHHGQSILCGCGLLSNENTDTFVWLFNDDECDVKCTCRLFEFRGIMCRHALIVLTLIKSVEELPSKYILDRWRKDLKRKYTFVKSSYDDLSGNPKAQNEAIDGSFKKCNKLWSPLVAKSKGRLPSTRKQSVVERVVRKFELHSTIGLCHYGQLQRFGYGDYCFCTTFHSFPDLVIVGERGEDGMKFGSSVDTHLLQTLMEQRQRDRKKRVSVGRGALMTKWRETYRR
ncbi:uncharacterized protein LOC133856714 [Alnus glutinosa]|uniref:uncharacterized protein LOC133856714 n=1 Tax=Alnus glutinosa TaxID=3517 RepID=UPI002D76C5A8|nr:uncharacterized protein LOC133856714 [Alnus glutinosa]